jgi:hypothetical protein
MAEQSPEKPIQSSSPSRSAADEFARHASTGSTGIVRECWLFLRDNKKWWLTPIIIVLLLVALLIVLGGTGAAPFIYTLF